MIKIKRYPIIAVLVLLSIIINSCKREKTDNVSALLAKDYWQLASLRVQKYLGDSRLSDTTITCDTVQKFTFKKDKTCTFNNFGCAANSISGTWSLSGTRLYLYAQITAPDSAGNPYQPFANSRIVNLGEYSLVLETGDIQTYYTSTDRRTIYRWGFVRIKTSTK